MFFSEFTWLPMQQTFGFRMCICKKCLIIYVVCICNIFCGISSAFFIASVCKSFLICFSLLLVIYLSFSSYLSKSFSICLFSVNGNQFYTCFSSILMAQSAGVVEYTDCISAEIRLLPRVSWI